MIRIARLTDYGLVLLTHMASHPEQPVFSTRELAERTGLPLPTVSKVLKMVAQAGILASQRGVAGGYRLARSADAISIASVIDAIEGPIALTLCSQGPGSCDIEGTCPDRGNWVRINRVIRDALDGISLAQMARPIPMVQIGATAAAPARSD